MKKFVKNSVLLLVGFSLLFSCSYKPILYKNSFYQNEGEEAANEEIARCEKEANDYLKQYKARRAAKEALRKGAWGAFFGGIFSFIFGGNVRAIAKGAAIGAGIGAAYGGLSVAGEGRINPDQIKQRYITKCLNEKGYEVIGWE